MPVDAVGLVAIRPGHGDVDGVALLKAVPLLVAEHVEIESVELHEVLGDLACRIVERRILLG